MCTFINALPKSSKTAEILGAKKKRGFMSILLRPTDEGKIYRFRLLGFKSSANDRDFPFIEKYVHEVWGDNDKGKRVLIDSITCPTSKYVTNFQGNPFKDCPICAYSASNFNVWKSSNYKDKIAGNNQRNTVRKFNAIIPLYVVQDPNVPENNGHIKTLILTDKDLYKNILALIKQKQKEDTIFNGTEAVDLWIDVKKEEVVYREGTPTEYRSSVTKIVNYGFTTKPYTIDTITKELIDAFPFDAEYYVSNTKEELVDFYDKYIAARPAVANVPEEDVASLLKGSSGKSAGSSTTKPASPVIQSTPIQDNKPVDQAVGEIDIDELIGAGKPVEQKTEVSAVVKTVSAVETAEREMTEEEKTQKLLEELNIA